MWSLDFMLYHNNNFLSAADVLLLVEYVNFEQFYIFNE